MAVENPDDIDGIMKQAEENSKKKKESGGGKEESKRPEVRVTLFQNGFTVDNGELREYNTEENKEFMSELNKGYVPKEL